MNKIIISGYLGRDPEMQTLSNGTEKCRFSVGVKRRVKKVTPPLNLKKSIKIACST